MLCQNLAGMTGHISNITLHDKLLGCMSGVLTY